MMDIFAQHARRVIEQYKKDEEEGKWVNGDLSSVVGEVDRLRGALCDIKERAEQQSTHPFDIHADYFRMARAALGEGKE